MATHLAGVIPRMLRVNPGVLVQGVWETVVCVFSCYYQHDYLRGLSVFLSETCAWVLRVWR